MRCSIRQVRGFLVDVFRLSSIKWFKIRIIHIDLILNLKREAFKRFRYSPLFIRQFNICLGDYSPLSASVLFFSTISISYPSTPILSIALSLIASSANAP